MRFVDAYGFGGGFTLGAVQSGLELVAKREGKGGFGIPMMEGNRELLGTNWKAQADVPQAWEPVAAPIVLSNPPCSGFSIMSILAGHERKDYRGIDAPSNNCMRELVHYATRCEGVEMVAFESVQGAFKMGRPLMQELRAYLNEHAGGGWSLTHVKHNVASLGGASIRPRYFFVASKVPFGVESPHVTHVPTFREAVGDLAAQPLAWPEQPYVAQAGCVWAEGKRSPSGQVRGHDVLNEGAQSHLERLNQVLSYGDWGVSERLIQVVQRHYEADGTWPLNWKELDKDRALRTEFRSGLHQPWRWYPDKAARVLSGTALTNVVHPWEDRTLTYREVARIMGFPDDWNVDPYRDTPNGHCVFGKGITVEGGKWLGGWLKRALEGDPGKWQGEVIGEDERLVDITHDHKIVYDEKTGLVRDSRNKKLIAEMAARPA